MLNNDPMKVYETSAMLHQFFHRMDKQERVMVIEALDQTIERIEADMANGIPHADISAEVHYDMDRVLNQAMFDNPESKHITCRSGCAHCCRQIVAIAKCEAEELIRVAQTNHIPIDRDRLARQAGQTNESWQQLSAYDRDCTFLKDNRCQVYDHRPLSCRKYYVVSEPEFCDIQKYPKRPVPVILNPDAEILTTAAMTAFGTGYLPDMLLKVLQQKEGQDEVL